MPAPPAFLLLPQSLLPPLLTFHTTTITHSRLFLHFFPTIKSNSLPPTHHTKKTSSKQETRTLYLPHGSRQRQNQTRTNTHNQTRTSTRNHVHHKKQPKMETLHQRPRPTKPNHKQLLPNQTHRAKNKLD